MHLIIGIAVVLWFVFGSPMKNVANWFWGDAPAPWEDVDAVYYPNANNLTIDMKNYNVGSVENCRAWVYWQAKRRGDPNLERGDYECGVGYLENFGSLRIYRRTVE